MTSIQYVYAYLQYTVINIHWPFGHVIFPILGIEIPKAGVFQSYKTVSLKYVNTDICLNNY